jgi:hypothetical protein
MRFQCDYKVLAEYFDIGFAEFEEILNQFEGMGFLEQQKFLGGKARICMKVSSHDFVLRGGFVAQEELIAQNIEKLLLEIESLKPSMPDKVSAITTIAANIATALALFVGK